MKPPANFGAVFGVRPGEGRRLSVLILSSFFLGAALVLYYTATNAIFLTSFSSATLPYVYITSAVLTVVFGVLYGALQKRVSLLALLCASNALLAAAVLLFWAVMQFSQSDTVIFLSMTWFRLLFIFTTMGMWEMASAVFDVRQAKRLFSLIGLGLMSAFVIGGLSTPLIVGAVGTRNMLLLSALFLLLYTAILLRLFPRLGIQAAAPNAQPPPPLRQIFANRYVRLILGLKTFSMLTAYVIEFVFYQQAALNYPDQKELANFLGSFIGLSTLVMVLVAATVAGRYISRFGLKIALPTMPLAIVLTSLASALYGLLVSLSGFFFTLVSSIMFSNQVFEKSIDTPATAVLYQAMPRALRMPVRVMVEGWFGSVALIFSGLLLILFSWLPVENILPFLFLLVAIGLGFSATALLTYRAYTRQLRAAVQTRFHAVQTPSQQAALTTQLFSEHPGPGLAAVEAARSEVHAALLAEEKPKAILLLRALRQPGQPRLRRALQQEFEQLRRQVIQRLSLLDSQWNDLQYFLEHPQEERRAAALEMLEVSLPGGLRRLSLALLEDLSPEKRLARLGETTPPNPPGSAESLRQIIARPQAFHPWTVLCARLALAQDPQARPDETHVEEAMTTAIEKVDLLRGVDIFSHTPDAALLEIAAALREQSAAAGQTIIQQGDLDDTLYLVISGRVRVHAGEDTLRIIAAGEMVGELALLDPAPRAANVTALEDCRFFTLDSGAFYDLLHDRPEVVQDILRVLARRIRAQSVA